MKVLSIGWSSTVPAARDDRTFGVALVRPINWRWMGTPPYISPA